MTSKRMVTLDIVRGLCIMGMVGVHIFRRTYDLSWLGTEAMAEKSLLHLVTLFGIGYFGGMAGLFLMVSTVSHTLSIREQLKAGKPLNKVISRQLMGGFILLLFAFLVEAVLGQHGFLGKMAYVPLVGIEDAVIENSTVILYRGFHFMTLHTIAWAAIVNSVIQWFLLRNGGEKKVARNIKVYIGLTVAVLLLTPLAWHFASWVVPGYPFATYPGTDRMVQYPLEGVSTAIDYVILFFLGPLAGQTEPLFPFLFISFIGAIIGIYLSMDRPPKYLPQRGMMAGGVMLIVGIIGLMAMFIMGLDDIGTVLEDPYLILRMNIWMPLLFFTTGGQIMLLMMMVRLIEWRNIASKVAERTVFIRRFAIVSLTVYTFQYIDTFPLHLMDHIFGISVFNGKDEFFWSIMSVATVLVMWHLLLKVWERYDFRGSSEWALAVFIGRLNSLLRGRSRGEQGWYLVPKLNTISGPEKVEWMEMRPKGLKGVDLKRDSILSVYLSVMGLVIFPLILLAYRMARTARDAEGPNRFNDLSLRISRIGIGWASIATFYLSQVRGLVIG